LVPSPLYPVAARSNARGAGGVTSGIGSVPDKRLSLPVGGEQKVGLEDEGVDEAEATRRRSLSSLDSHRHRRKVNRDQAFLEYESGVLTDTEIPDPGLLRVMNGEEGSPEPPRKNSIERPAPPPKTVGSISRKQLRRDAQSGPAYKRTDGLPKLKTEQGAGLSKHGDGRRRSRLSVIGVSLLSRTSLLLRMLTAIVAVPPVWQPRQGRRICKAFATTRADSFSYLTRGADSLYRYIPDTKTS
jgi:hypothetical protein